MIGACSIGYLFWLQGFIGLFEKIWLEEVEGVIGPEGGVAGDAGWGYGFLFFIGPYSMEGWEDSGVYVGGE